MQESPQVGTVITSKITIIVDPNANKTAAEAIDEIREHTAGVLVIRVPVHVTSALLHRLANDEFKHCAVDTRF